MKKCAWMVALAVILLPAAASVFAQVEAAVEPTEDKKVKKAKKFKKGRKKTARGLKGYWAIASKQLELTDEQNEKISKLLEEKSKAEAEAAEIEKTSVRLAEIKAERKKEGISKAEDKKLLTEMKEIRSGGKKAKEEFQTGLAEILTDEQNAKLKCYNYYAGKVRKYAKKNLTDEQKAEVRKLTDAACAEIDKAEKKGATKEIEKKLIEDIQELLTDEQKAGLKKGRKKGHKSKK